MSYCEGYWAGYWEGYRPKHRRVKRLLPGIENQKGPPMKPYDENTIHDKGFEALGGLGVPMARTRTRAKKAREKLWELSLKPKPKCEDVTPKRVNCIMTEEDP